MTQNYVIKMCNGQGYSPGNHAGEHALVLLRRLLRRWGLVHRDHGGAALLITPA